jgi:hypothetical protein
MDEKLETAPKAQAPQPDVINQATLTPLVRSALNSETVQVINWDFEQLHGGAGSGNAIYCFTGQGRDQEQKMPWSLILKTVYPEGDNTDISAWDYYKREVDAYRSGWLDDLPGGLATPHSFGVNEHPDGTCWIWLEDVTDDIGSHWPLEHYGIVARHLGQFNGAYLGDRPLPSWPWLSSGWWRKYIAESAPAIPLIRNSLDHPLVRREWPGDASDRLSCLWEERDVFLDALDRLPQTICHFDLFRRNLFAQKPAGGGYHTVVIDWAFAGHGAIGEELVPLILANIGFQEVDLAQAQELEDIVFEGYLEGLSNAGWQGDPLQVRLGYAAASLRYGFGDLDWFMAIIMDENQHNWMQQVFGCSIEEVLDHFAQVGSFRDRLIDEARELMDVLG